MGKIHRWNKFGQMEVYEGTHGVAVGRRDGGYAVFASAKGLKIYRNTWKAKTHAGYCGEGFTKRRASGLVKAIDEALEKPCSPMPIIAIISPTKEPFEAFARGDSATGGMIVAYEKGDEIALAHEKAHYLAGHFVPTGRKRRSKLKEEKEAVAIEIRLLKWGGGYTPEARGEIIRHFSSYFKGPRALEEAGELVDEVGGKLVWGERT